MCIDCYEGYGAPTGIDEKVLAAVPLITAAGGWGGMHIAIEDWNLEDENLAYCAAHPETPEDALCAAAMLDMTLEQRAAALAIHDGFLSPDGRLLVVSGEVSGE